jgi:Gpi18-like mannosyltransferase
MPSSIWRVPRFSKPARHQAAFVTILALFSLGAEAPAPSGSNGMLIGAMSGAILLTIVVITFARLVLPLRNASESGLDSALITLGALATVKVALIPFFPGFGADVGSYQAWALQIATLGPAHTYQEGYFLDYPPGYLYGLWVAGTFARLVNASGETLRVIAESPAIVADFFLAVTMFAFMRRTGRGAVAFAAALMVALNPAFLFDTVVWGQSDSVLSFTMLLSVIALLDQQYDLCWALAAISVLIKPQGLMLVPVLGWWTMLETDVWRWLRSGLVAIAVFIIGIAPFQIGHPWNWILNLYTSTAAYYHETSVNAFNLMALIGGLRQGDEGLIGGVSYFALGMSMLIPLYGFIAWILWRKRSRTTLIYSAFIAVFGFFMVAPRMHERYLYPSLVFAIPLALESTEILALFAVLSLTCLFNLAYVLHTLQTVVFLNSRDTLAMAASAINAILFGLAAYYGAVRLEGVSEGSFNLSDFAKTLFPERPPVAAVERPKPPVWNRTDTIALTSLLVAGAITRFWHLGHPHEIVFDEIHFVANQARHYLHGEYFLDPHPPLDKLIIAAGIWLFGDKPWSWRVGNAILGTILVGTTYLLGRRMTHSRLAGTFAGAIVLLDGMFLVDSRIGVIDIAYLTFAAISYLLLFRFLEMPNNAERRGVLPWLGLSLGLCVASKLYIPAITFLLVMGFLVWVLMREPYGGRRDQRTIGAVLLVGAIASIVYIAMFLPHFYLGWWAGIEDLFHYYSEIVWYEGSVASATHPYSSPWWSWPLMLRPIAYWQDFPKTGKVSTIWGGGNPLLWWGGLTAMTINTVRAFERPSLERSFLVIGYLGYFMIWAWIGRTLFLYHYMAAVYLAYVALAWILQQCWVGEAEPWEHLALLLTMAPVFVLGVGPLWGATVFVALVAMYFYLLRTPYAGQFVCVIFSATAVILFIYYFPIWTGMPIERDGYYARMWLQGPGLRDWI